MEGQPKINFPNPIKKEVHATITCMSSTVLERICAVMSLRGLLQVELEVESLLARQRTLLKIRDKLLEQIAVNQRAPKADWQSQFSWDAKVQDALETVFRLADFRCCVDHIAYKS